MASQTSGRPPTRAIKKLLVANRGEIATRIISAAREHTPNIETYVLSTSGDTGHTLHADHVLTLPSASSYTNIPALLDLIRQHAIDTVHPGYGFLSESAEFAKRAWEEAGAAVVGPGWEVLERTGDKLKAKALARENGVPVLEATLEPTGTVDAVKDFIQRIGLPVMVKAVDGGGGRGVRLITQQEDIESLTARAIAESPSRQVFVEMAAVDGFRHVEVQILGDGTGEVRHLWERECSIQRRYQKIVEVAPSTISNRKFVAKIIDAAVSMARSIKYFSLGTFEFLANPDSEEFFFLEVNPRLQVEHTVTECISQVDIVTTQLQLQQGLTLFDTALAQVSQDTLRPPAIHSIQLRLCAENPASNFSLSIGKITSFSFPSGSGVRVDTAILNDHDNVISSDFDSLIAKVIVTSLSWQGACEKALRALVDTRIVGIQTNLSVLRAIVSSEAFRRGESDTSWFERNAPRLVAESQALAAASRDQDDKFYRRPLQASTGSSNTTNVLFRKGDAWEVKLTPKDAPKDTPSQTHHLKVQRVTRNEFPTAFSADIEYASTAASQSQAFSMNLVATSASSASIAALGKHRQGDTSRNDQVVIPFSGKLVELLVDEGDVLKEGDVVCIVQQMKMELEIRCKRGGRIKWLFDVEDGEDVAEGVLVAELDTRESPSLARL